MNNCSKPLVHKWWHAAGVFIIFGTVYRNLLKQNKVLKHKLFNFIWLLKISVLGSLCSAVLGASITPCTDMIFSDPLSYIICNIGLIAKYLCVYTLLVQTVSFGPDSEFHPPKGFYWQSLDVVSFILPHFFDVPSEVFQFFFSKSSRFGRSLFEFCTELSWFRLLERLESFWKVIDFF